MMTEFLQDISTEHISHKEGKYFINCSGCRWEATPAEDRVRIMIKSIVKKDMLLKQQNKTTIDTSSKQSPSHCPFPEPVPENYE